MVLSHTPPQTRFGSLEKAPKRMRSGSLSTRLRSASILCDDVDKETKGALKDLIIRDDPALQDFMRRIEQGDKTVVRELVEKKVLAKGRDSGLDIMGNKGSLDLNLLQMDDDVQSLKEEAAMNDGQVNFEFTFNQEDDEDDVFETAIVPNKPLKLVSNYSVQSSRSEDSVRKKPVPGGSFLAGDGLRTRSGRGFSPSKLKTEKSNAGPNRDRFASFEQLPMEQMLQSMGDMFGDESGRPSSAGNTLGTFGSTSPPGPSASSLESAARNSTLSTKHLDDMIVNGSGLGGSFDASDPIGIPARNRFSSMSSLASFGHLPPANTIIGGNRSILGSIGSTAEFQPAPSNKAKTRSGGFAMVEETKPVRPSRRRRKPKKLYAFDDDDNNDERMAGESDDDGDEEYSDDFRFDAARPNRFIERGRVRSQPQIAGNSEAVPIPRRTPIAAPSIPAVEELRKEFREGQIGAYSPESRQRRIDRFLEKRPLRVWKKRVTYNVRKDFADTRLRVKGRFVKKEDEGMLRDLMVMTM